VISGTLLVSLTAYDGGGESSPGGVDRPCFSTAWPLGGSSQI